FITELSSVIRNCPAASVSSTMLAPRARSGTATSTVVITCTEPVRAGVERESPAESDTRASDRPPELGQTGRVLLVNTASRRRLKLRLRKGPHVHRRLPLLGRPGIDALLLPLDHLVLVADQGLRRRLSAARHRRRVEGAVDHLRDHPSVPRRVHLS